MAVLLIIGRGRMAPISMSRRASLFPGSRALLCYADKIEQVLIGGNESYLPVCRRHFHADVLPTRE